METVLKTSTKLLKPRGFFPKHAKELIKTGPPMWEVNKLMKKRINGQGIPFIFGAGRNPLQLGGLLTRALKWDINSFNSFDADLEMCETNMRGPVLFMESILMRRLGVKEKVINQIYGETKVKICSSAGNHCYEMPLVRLSGTANTTVGNTLSYMTLLWAVLMQNGIKDDEFLCLISGDDCALMVHKKINVDKIKYCFNELIGLGIQPELKQHDHFYKMSFYSGRFIPVVSSTGCIVLRHAPMIFRTIFKSFSVKSHNSINWKTIAFNNCYSRYLCEYVGVPILYNWNLNLMKIFEPYKDINIKNVERNYMYIESKSKIINCNININTYIAVAIAYETTVEHIIQIENDVPDLGSDLTKYFDLLKIDV
jgi:hypothetical protein